jgi:hypothetical protein
VHHLFSCSVARLETENPLALRIPSRLDKPATYRVIWEPAPGREPLVDTVLGFDGCRASWKVQSRYLHWAGLGCRSSCSLSSSSVITISAYLWGVNLRMVYLNNYTYSRVILITCIIDPRLKTKVMIVDIYKILSTFIPWSQKYSQLIRCTIIYIAPTYFSFNSKSDFQWHKSLQLREYCSRSWWTPSWIFARGQSSFEWTYTMRP